MALDACSSLMFLLASHFVSAKIAISSPPLQLMPLLRLFVAIAEGLELQMLRGRTCWIVKFDSSWRTEYFEKGV
jgi:hypothetical protein